MTGEAGGKNPGVDYAKDNRTTHLIARSDKSVDYVQDVTDNNRLYSTFCTVEANY